MINSKHSRSDVATGYDETLTYKGRVSYKFDRVLWSLGHRGPDAYLKDENGDPVPETVPKCDLKMARWVLEPVSPQVRQGSEDGRYA